MIFSIDDQLRRHHGVVEFSSNPLSIFRMQVRPFDQAVSLGDGTTVRPGERIVDLHLWNEQLPLMPQGSLHWARLMRRSVDVSLRELHRHLATRPELDDVALIRANMAFGTRDQTEQLARLAGSFGFEARARTDVPSLGKRIHLFGENLLISLMVLARNKAALRRDSLARDRVQVFLSRRILADRYGVPAPVPSAREPGS